jgi:hypothetical protein
VSVSTVARRITREHNRAMAPEEISRDGGVLIFDTKGQLQAWHTHDNRDYGPTAIVYRVRPHNVTQVEVQAWLDARR